MGAHHKKIVIVGATSAIAEHCARLWAEDGPSEVVLVGRDPSKLEIVAQDLRVRSPVSTVTSAVIDFLKPEVVKAFVDRVCEDSPVDIVLIAHGVLPEQQVCQGNLAECKAALDVNGTSPVVFAEAFATWMEKVNKGTLAVIGSVAGDRGRKSNYIYGAAKSLVSVYVGGLQHRLAGTGVNVILVKPGPTNTPMTAGCLGIKLAPVQAVAQRIVKGINSGKPVIYAPLKWALIMLVIRHIPRNIFNRLDI